MESIRDLWSIFNLRNYLEEILYYKRIIIIDIINLILQLSQ